MKQSSKFELALLLVVLAVGLRAAAAEHPVKLEKDADCATCHEDKTKGKAVHSAIAMGCTTCHDVKTEGETTTVNLTAPRDQLCFTCHEKQAKEKDTVHGPYEKGQCVTCHDPHTSDFARQLRAEGNNLCLECHNPYRKADDKVLLFGKTEITKDDFREIPKVDLDRELKIGHPIGRHPVTEVANPVKPDEKIACTTCHQTHVSPAPKLLRMSKPGDDLCFQCHSVMDKKATEENEKKSLESAQKAGQALQDSKNKKNSKKKNPDGGQ